MRISGQSNCLAEYRFNESMKRLLSILILFVCLFSQALAENVQGRTIRVGFPPVSGFNEISKNGTYSGYDVDYLRKIAQQTNWKYEFVVAPWSDCLNMLKEGKVDILGGMERTPEREKIFHFARLESFLNDVSLLARADDTRFLHNNLNEYHNLTVGVLKESQDIESLKKYSAANGLSFRLKEYDSLPRLNEAFLKGEFDIILSSGLNKIHGQQILTSFSPTPLFYAVWKNAPEILAELDRAQAHFKSVDRFYDYRLYQKHYGFTESNRPTLTRQERHALQDMPPMRMAFVPGWRPVAYMNENKPHGIISDLLASIAASSGLRIQYVMADSHEEALDLVQSGKADAVAFIVLNNQLPNQNDLKLSIPFLQSPLTMVMANDRNRKLPVTKVGLTHIMNKYFVEELLQNTPGIEETVRNSPYALLNALNDGKIDAAYINVYSANAFLSWPEFSGLSSHELADNTVEFAIAFSPETDTNVISAINKYIRQLRSFKMQEFVIANTAQRPDPTLFTLIREKPVSAFYIFSLVLLLTIGVFSFIIITRSRSHKRIADLLYFDQITRLPNLVKFNELAEEALKNEVNSFALVYININNFKHINDIHDFSKGNFLLCTVADKLKEFIDETRGEMACRMTADHFALLLSIAPDTPLNKRITVLDTQLSSFNDIGLNMHISFSCGIYRIKSGDTINTAVNYAHYAQVSQRRTSYNTYTFFDDKLIERIRTNRIIEREMTAALAQGQFVPYFQPKVSMATGQIVGAEALARWQHPEKGLISPDEFIPLFEKNNFIVQLDLSIFEEVCKILRKLMNEGKKVFPCSCNFSHNHFMDRSLPEKLLAITTRHHIPAKLLDIEITETSVIYDMDAVIDVTRALRETGFKISLDDFGVGYSSVNLLCQIKVDTIKLDRSFLDQASILPCKRTLVEGIVGTGNDLGIDVLCEGVETELQTIFLKQAGCWMAQGYYYGRPVPFEEFSKRWLNRYEQDIVLS